MHSRKRLFADIDFEVSPSVRISPDHILNFNIDGFVKSPKSINFQISHTITSIGYRIDI